MKERIRSVTVSVDHQLSAWIHEGRQNDMTALDAILATSVVLVGKDVSDAAEPALWLAEVDGCLASPARDWFSRVDVRVADLDAELERERAGPATTLSVGTVDRAERLDSSETVTLDSGIGSFHVSFELTRAEDGELSIRVARDSSAFAPSLDDVDRAILAFARRHITHCVEFSALDALLERRLRRETRLRRLHWTRWKRARPQATSRR